MVISAHLREAIAAALFIVPLFYWKRKSRLHFLHCLHYVAVGRSSQLNALHCICNQPDADGADEEDYHHHPRQAVKLCTDFIVKREPRAQSFSRHSTTHSSTSDGCSAAAYFNV